MEQKMCFKHFVSTNSLTKNKYHASFYSGSYAVKWKRVKKSAFGCGSLPKVHFSTLGKNIK